MKITQQEHTLQKIINIKLINSRENKRNKEEVTPLMVLCKLSIEDLCRKAQLAPLGSFWN